MHELERQGVSPALSWSTVYRLLVRHRRVDARARKRRCEGGAAQERELASAHPSWRSRL
ncbi:MAG TPA: hypothetical protein VFW64_01820 [Pseudonocardiaceae bacterium]|nr:hypothetical protein [Pseudonocardiaceae bacterium]